MASLPDRVSNARRDPHPALVRTAVSPAAVALTAAGAGIGVLDHSLTLAIVLAAVGWGGRMLGAVVTRARRRRASQPAPPEIDPWSVPEPWRQLMQQAASARLRFDQVLAEWPKGPTRDELARLQPQVWAHVGEIAVLARRGAAADGWNGASFASPGRVDALQAELGRLQREKVRYAGSERAAAADAREAALAAQLREARRHQEVSQAMRDRLGAAVARLDTNIVDLVALEPTPQPDVSSVAGALDDLSDRLSSLRTALEETTEAPEGNSTA